MPNLIDSQGEESFRQSIDRIDVLLCLYHYLNVFIFYDYRSKDTKKQTVFLSFVSDTNPVNYKKVLLYQPFNFSVCGGMRHLSLHDDITD
jgi:hypothetical protein